jgi:Mrp family chromosome partitioning ATPase
LLADLMTSLRHSHDYIIVEASPATRGSDAQSVAALADATLLVVQKETAQMDRLAVIRQQFKRVAAPVRGIVLTNGTLPTGPSPSPLGAGGSPAALSPAVGAASDA